VVLDDAPPVPASVVVAGPPVDVPRGPVPPDGLLWCVGVGIETPTLSSTFAAKLCAPSGNAPANARPVVVVSPPARTAAAARTERIFHDVWNLRRVLGGEDPDLMTAVT
jgi:hypothetical protein